MDQDISSLEKLAQEYVATAPTGEPAKLTLTWAQSIDGCISAGRGLRTKLSGSHSHKMTHYLRSLHDAILVGRGTVEADNPKLNCRYPGASGHPRPIILDSNLHWEAEKGVWAVLDGAKSGTGKAPWVLSTRPQNQARIAAIESVGGRVVILKDLEWDTILQYLGENSIGNVMVEGGARVLASTIAARISHCMIVTLAPVFLGKEGVWATPNGRFEFSDPKWWNSPGVADSVLLCRPKTDDLGLEGPA